MASNVHDLARRRWLIATSTVGGIGIVGAAVPFVDSMQPSERAKALGAPVEADVAAVRPGQLTTVEWRGKPVWILHRTPEMVRSLQGHDDLLADPQSKKDQQPDYARNATRSIRPEYGVLVGICTHLGCVPSFRPEPGSVAPDWPGGFYCPCHGSRFDLAGRVFKNVPAPSNLEVPPYHFDGATKVVVGVGPDGKSS